MDIMYTDDCRFVIVYTTRLIIVKSIVNEIHVL